MLLKTTLLEDAVEGVGFVDHLSTAVHQSEDLEPHNIDLLVALVLLTILEVRGEQHFGKSAIWVLQGLPG